MAKIDDGTSIVKMVDWTDDVEGHYSDTFEAHIAYMRARNDMVVSNGLFRNDVGNPFMDDNFHSALQRQAAPGNPLLEIVKAFIKATEHKDAFSWFREYPDLNDPYQSVRIARLEGVVLRERGFSGQQSSYNYGHFSPHYEDVTISFDLYDHDNLKALLYRNVWRFSRKTRDLIKYVSPLVSAMGDGQRVRISFEYREHHQPLKYAKYTDDTKYGTRTFFELCGVLLVVGDLVLRSNFHHMDEVDHVCRRIDHTTILICNRKIKNILRKAYFVCNDDEVMFYFDYDKVLKNMIAGSRPTENEMLLIDMAGHKEEFWLDDIKSFNALEIKPFDLEESTKCYLHQLPVYRF